MLHNERALTAKPDNLRALKSLTMRYVEKNMYEKVVSTLEKGLVIDPGNLDKYYIIACLYTRQGRVDESVGYLGKALKSGFGNYDLMRTDPDLNRVRASEAYQALIARINVK